MVHNLQDWSGRYHSTTSAIEIGGLVSAPADTSLESIVSVSSEAMSGTPVFRGTRVPVKNLLDYLAAGDSLDEFMSRCREA